jgi:GrpB-like predicted nucleotidyltransferase (UPF0157 family)
MAAPVIIEPYDPTWPIQFEGYRAAIAGAMGDLALEIIHLGSTAVPGLAAKPIIDMILVIAAEADLAETVRRLATIGYRFEGDLGVTGRYAFDYPPGTARHHLYVCPLGAPAIERQIAFRDYLRRHADQAAAYEALKRASAIKFRDDRTGYTDSKREWVEQALERARDDAET